MSKERGTSRSCHKLMSEVPLYLCSIHKLMSDINLCARYLVPYERRREREIFIDNLLVRVHLIIEMSRPALRHGSLNSLFQVALYLPS